MTGVFNLRPPKPKLSFVWDVDIFFKYFEQGDNNSDNQTNYWHKSLQFYYYCLVLIELVLSNYLVHLIWFLNDLLITFIPTEVLKHSRKGKPLDKFEYRSYTDNKLCIISCLREYFTRQDKHVGLDTGQLINILKKPFKGHQLIQKGYGSKISLYWIILIFLLIASRQPQPVKQKTWRSTLMRYSNEVAGKTKITFSSITINS